MVHIPPTKMAYDKLAQSRGPTPPRPFAAGTPLADTVAEGRFIRAPFSLGE